MIKVVIIEDEPDINKIIFNLLSKHEAFDVVGRAYDGEEGLKVLMENEVDVALIDIVLPRFDGIAILEALSRKKILKKPICIMLTALNSETVTVKTVQFGADYIILKPFDGKILIQRILDLYNYKNNIGMQVPQETFLNALEYQAIPSEPEEFSAYALHKIGIGTNIKGFMYLKAAITKSIIEPSSLEAVTKILYPTIAKDFHSTPTRVERAMQHAIESTWKKGLSSNYYNFLGYTATSTKKPTNSVFISSIVEAYHTKIKKS